MRKFDDFHRFSHLRHDPFSIPVGSAAIQAEGNRGALKPPSIHRVQSIAPASAAGPSLSPPPKSPFRVNHLPRNPFGFLSGEKGDEPGGILRLTEPPGRKAGQELPFQFFGHPSRVRRPRIDGIHRNPPGSDLHGKGGSKRFDGTLGGRVGDLPRHRAEGLAGGEIDDASSPLSLPTPGKADAQQDGGPDIHRIVGVQGGRIQPVNAVRVEWAALFTRIDGGPNRSSTRSNTASGAVGEDRSIAKPSARTPLLLSSASSSAGPSPSSRILRSWGCHTKKMSAPLSARARQMAVPIPRRRPPRLQPRCGRKVPFFPWSSPPYRRKSVHIVQKPAGRSRRNASPRRQGRSPADKKPSRYFISFTKRSSFNRVFPILA